jgi:hypothetical protein
MSFEDVKMLATEQSTVITEVRAFDPSEHMLIADAVEQREAAVAEAVRKAIVAERERGEQEMEDFKARVAQAAFDAAEEHDWCAVAENLITDLGMTWPAESKHFTVTITLDVSAKRAAGGRVLTPSFVRDSQSVDIDDDTYTDHDDTRNGPVSQRFSWGLDDDFRDIQIEHVSTSVDGLD